MSHPIPVAVQLFSASAQTRSKNGPRLHGMATGLAATMAANWKETQQNSRGGLMGFQMCCSSVFGLSVIFFGEEHGKIASWINTSFI